MADRKNILICPLEWGLGHAGRMVPLARKLLEMNHNIIFGSGEKQMAFLRSEVPSATFINFPGFRISYSRYLPQYLIILLKSPLLIYHSILEHRQLEKIIRDHSVDIVISDNRIGLWNSGVKTVFVTHQLRIPFPAFFRVFEFLGILIIRMIIRKYTWCFVPDMDGEINVSGRLSHGFDLPGNVKYIGILSRLKEGGQKNNSVLPGYAVILSGPEPQRSILKQKLIKILLSQGKRAEILEGKPEVAGNEPGVNNIVFHNHLSSEETVRLLKGTESIITRAGYTTIMELISLGKSALLIPTPGQTEQEYLAEYLSGRGWFRWLAQKDIDGRIIMPATSDTSVPEINEASDKLLSLALKVLLEQ